MTDAQKPAFQSAAPSPAELAYGLPTANEEQQAATVQPVVRWLTDKKRVDTYELLYPLAVDGVEYRKVMLRRLTVADVDAFAARLKAKVGADDLRFPMYFGLDGALLPDTVWEALDDDDRFALTELGEDFLPARFRQEPEKAAQSAPQSTSDPSTGDTGGSSSAA